MSCFHCQDPSPNGHRFCGECGRPLPSLCPRCGTVGTPDLKFCVVCGHHLAADDVAPAASAPVEHRHLTVLFCDLVGSTALSGRLDPEDLHGLLQEVQRVCARVVGAHDGHIAQYLGDGLLIYFGYPTAHEDDAVRAVRAALQILDGIAELNRCLEDRGTEPVAVRVGIHTGNVVAGEVGAGPRREQLALGQTPNVAARIQGLAEPGTILVSRNTYALTQGFFNFEPLGPQQLRGVAEPIVVHRVLEESGIHGRFELAVRRGLAPLVGRRAEVGLLLGEMRRSREGTGRAVLVAGEAGIGKSRLVYDLRAEVKGEVASWWVYRGTPYTRNTSFYPVIEMIHVQLRLEPEDPVPVQLDKLEESCGAFGLDLAFHVPLLARLLSLPLEGRYPEQDDNPQLFKEKVLDFFVGFLLDRARHQPVVFLMEDLHWIDPSTLEFLDRLLTASVDAPLLLLFTARPAFTSPWDELPHLTRLDLARLSAAEGEHLVQGLAAPHQLSRELVDHILEKSDGVPLYLEEMTKSLLESDLVTAGDDGALTLGSGDSRIPTTLRDSLTARLDRLGPAKEVAQIGSALGREFPHDLLRAVSGLPEAALRERLGRLISAELLFRRLEGQVELYSFKHALVQDAAHLSMAKTRRRAIHGSIAGLLEGAFADTREAEPEQRAHHWEEAGRPDDAVRCLLEAGRKAAGTSAYTEGRSHCLRALGLLGDLAETPERLARELEVRATLGPCLIATRGYTSEEVEANYARSRQVIERLDDPRQLVPTLYGLFVYHLVRGHRQPSIELAEAIQAQGDPDDELHRFLGPSARGHDYFYLGRFPLANRTLGEAVSLYRPELHPRFARIYGDDAGLLPHFYRFWSLSLCGEVDTAAAECARTFEILDDLDSPYARATGLLFETIMWREQGDVERTAATVERWETLCDEQRYPFFQALSRIFRGWVLFERGERERGRALTVENLEIYRAIGAELATSYYLTFLSEYELALGDFEKGLALADEGIAAARERIDPFYDAEHLRLRGEHLARLGRPEEAEAAFRDSLDLSAETGAKLFALKAALGFARFLASRDRDAEGRALLATAHGALSQGLDTRYPRAARRLLNEVLPDTAGRLPVAAARA